MFYKEIILGVSLLTITGCNQPTISIDQESLCEVSDWQKDITASSCKTGQKVVYLPKSFGNEQLPVIFAAVNCDHRFSIALTKGGVSCIYSPLKPETATKSKG